MPRRRKDKAAELIRLIQKGPSFGPLAFTGSNAERPPHEVAAEGARLWLSSWVEPLVRERCLMMAKGDCDMTQNIDQVVYVTAYHSCEDFRFRSTEVKTFGRSYGWFATHPKLGCGKTYPTQERAVRGLFADHACTEIQIVSTLAPTYR